MFISKFWFTLLTLAMGAAVAALLLARHSHNLAREDDTRRLLLKDREQGWALLKSESRQRLDEVLRISSDTDVMRVLEKASNTPEKVTPDDRSALSAQLQKQNKNLESYAADLLVAVDRNGDAVAHVWEGGPQKATYGLGGFPAVDSALRGFMQDDVWALSTNGDNPDQVKVYRVAVRPVISKGLYVGAIVHGQHLNDAFAAVLAERLEAQIVFFRGSVMLGSAVPSDPNFHQVSDQVVLSEMSRLLQDEAFLTTGQSQIVDFGEEAVGLYSLIRGEAALVEGARVGYAIIRPVPSMASSMEFLTNATIEEWKDMASSPSGITLFIAVFLALVMGFVAFFIEHGGPLHKLRREVRRLADREIDRMNIYGVARKHRTIAESINKAMDKAIDDVADKLGKKSSDIDSILGPSQAMDRGVSTPLFSFTDGSGEDVPPAPPGKPAAGGPVRHAPASPAMVAKPAGPPGPPAAPPMGGPPLGGPPAPRAPVQQPAAKPIAPTQAPQKSPMPPAHPATPAVPAPKPAPPAPRPAAPAPKPAAPSPTFGTVPSSSEIDEDYDDDDRTEIAGVPEELLVDSKDEIPADEGTYFRQIFDKFVETKKQCGERTDNLQFERFTQTLKRNRNALVERYGCKAVRFQVYVKEGKAALKATPVRS
jgi:hypothetical protein